VLRELKAGFFGVLMGEQESCWTCDYFESSTPYIYPKLLAKTGVLIIGEAIFACPREGDGLSVVSASQY
jgi:hypothetical protein